MESTRSTDIPVEAADISKPTQPDHLGDVDRGAVVVSPSEGSRLARRRSAVWGASNDTREAALGSAGLMERDSPAESENRPDIQEHVTDAKPVVKADRDTERADTFGVRISERMALRAGEILTGERIVDPEHRMREPKAQRNGTAEESPQTQTESTEELTETAAGSAPTTKAVNVAGELTEPADNHEGGPTEEHHKPATDVADPPQPPSDPLAEAAGLDNGNNKVSSGAVDTTTNQETELSNNQDPVATAEKDFHSDQAPDAAEAVGNPDQAENALPHATERREEQDWSGTAVEETLGAKTADTAGPDEAPGLEAINDSARDVFAAEPSDRDSSGAGETPSEGAEYSEEGQPPDSAGASDRPPTDRPPAPPGEAGADGDPYPLLPSTEADVQWEAWHEGEIVQVGSPDSGAVYKIYRRPLMEKATLVLETPQGLDVPLTAGDIVQVFPRDQSGNLAQKPSDVFQPVFYDLPEGYTTTIIDPEAHAAAQAAIEQLVSHLRAEPDTEVIGGRAHTHSKPLKFISDIVSDLAYGRGSWQITVLEAPATENPHEAIVRYPMFGRSVAAITPRGFLLKGKANDIIEIVHTGPDGSYTPLKRQSFDELTKGGRYIRLL